MTKLQWEARKALAIGVAIAIFVTGIAVVCSGQGPRWTDNFRWFVAGLSCMALVFNWWAFRINRRTAQRDRETRADMDRVAGEFADAVKRELEKRGIDGEVEMKHGAPPPRLH